MDQPQISEIKRIFKALDTNDDGVISFQEYAVTFKQLVTKWLTMEKPI
jgi:Ca2+-binding EF-hand superfamily protein